MSLLRIEDLRIALPKGGDRAFAVDGVSLHVDQGETLCVVGESGSGKSLTASAIVGLLPSRSLRVAGGRILFEGSDTLRMSSRELQDLRGGRVGFVFQDPLSSLNPLERIGKQVEEVLRQHRWTGDHRQRVLEMLSAVQLPSPESLVEAYPWQLSGGQRQRVMIATALATRPSLLVADEPTSALDVTTQAQILELLRDLTKQHGIALFLITHDFGVVARMADRVAVMKSGKLVEYGTRDAVLRTPREAYTRKLLDAVPPLRAGPARPAGEPVLKATGLTKSWVTRGSLFRPGRTVAALKNVSMSLGHGNTLAVVGESGSGKSTLARVLMCLTGADSGQADLVGINANYLGLRSRDLATVRRNIQLVFQDPYASLNPRRRIGAAVAQGPLAQGEKPGAVHARVAELLGKVQLDPSAADRYPNEFSGGQRQRIAIARALAMRPRVLIADEAVSALDVSVQAEILTLLKDIQRDEGLSMIFVTHDLRVAARMADQVIVMQSGCVVEQGAMQDVLTAPQHHYTAALIDAVPSLPSISVQQ
ncbi:dipeptide ABC transporter ATP-binding protein [Oceanibacterium hippocampi]|uniref:Glutathione import ATP-binding protein GsiA n=1 Tax=Oceanibacterium hippocampi TaxID=745714 RepID=A0A1Y5TL98_9PROT|nr:ABC transporter ATP-binding protein [Oceanibacterium hippocampi]SLN66689.1 Glutathione import ATP-binding protein GsiA [Oceanibacterium hippocampi]